MPTLRDDLIPLVVEEVRGDIVDGVAGHRRGADPDLVGGGALGEGRRPTST
ncbi:MAG: hypothetical protein KC621_04415 [Myxococcales bacterium]|nr:hypothetical protein [Myxococcales bacterium]